MRHATRFKAWLLLGWVLSQHLMAWPFVRLASVLRRRKLNSFDMFRQRLAVENLYVSPSDTVHWVAASSRCIGCTLCDLMARADESPSQWIMASPRRPDDACLALHHAHRLRELAYEIARVCPTQVDVIAVARLIEANASASSGVVAEKLA